MPMLTGVIKKFFGDKGFGFITPDDGGDDLFVHRKVHTEDRSAYLEEGDKVEYEVEPEDKMGKPSACKCDGPWKTGFEGSGGGAKEMCGDFKRGMCDRGDRCRYSHGSGGRSRSRGRGGRSRSRGRGGGGRDRSRSRGRGGGGRDRRGGGGGRDRRGGGGGGGGGRNRRGGGGRGRDREPSYDYYDDYEYEDESRSPTPKRRRGGGGGGRR